MEDFPFIEKKMCERVYVRVFNDSVSESELVWHRDREDRIVEPLHETDWMLQMDNALPQVLSGRMFIPKESYHRIIKGTKPVAIKVIKF